MDGSFIGGLIGSLFLVAVVVVIFLIGREITLWYFRIPEFIKNQQKTIELLEQIVANQEDAFNASQAAQPQARVPTP